MEHVLSVEELIVSDSFVSYCYSKNPEDTSYWESYVLQHPAEKKTVEEARVFVLMMKDMLQNSEKQKALDRFRKALTEETAANGKAELNVVYMSPQVSRLESGTTTYRWYAAAAAIAVILFMAWMIISNEEKKQIDETSNAVANQMLIENSVTKTGGKERKIVFLPDGTKVTMNGNTTLTVDSGFGMNTRLVKLEGEAFFDVQHDKRAPFIVQLKDYRVRVLGTMFNVRSYPGDKNSETALVKGKVEIEENVSHHTLSLRPYEKAILPNGGFLAKASQQPDKSGSRAAIPIVIKPLTISNDGISISETAWMQNRLEINDETFVEIKNKLERWYGVSIRFNSEDVKQYRFTATFEKENIDQVLQAMQLSYPFKYTKTDNLIMIEK